MDSIPLLLGHRGARGIGSVAENTFAAFDLALQCGCDGFEFDVRATADGRAVVCHDEKVGEVRVAAAQENQLADLPELEDVLARYRQRSFLNIELKVAGLEEFVIRALRKLPPKKGFAVSSFLPKVICEIKNRDKSILTGLICENIAQLRKWRSLPADYVIPHKSLVDRRLVNDLRDAGRRIFVWTVNDVHTMRRFGVWGVDGIISDDPQKLMEAFRI